MNFQKYHGTGNDFIIIDSKPSDPNRLAKDMCDRHFGIGADGLIFPSRSTQADITFNYYNSDGSIAPMCGNGLRCFVKYLMDNHLIDKTSFKVETLAGLIDVTYQKETQHININLGKPTFALDTPDVSHPIKAFQEKTLQIEDMNVTCYTLNIGTLHTIVYKTKDMDMQYIGPLLSKHSFFPKHTNVNFVEFIDTNTQKVTTYERGAGWTLSCGTGTVASAIVSNKLGLVNDVIKTHVPGGMLHVYVEDDVFLEGPAVKIASGEFFQHE